MMSSSVLSISVAWSLEVWVVDAMVVLVDVVSVQIFGCLDVLGSGHCVALSLRANLMAFWHL